MQNVNPWFITGLCEGEGTFTFSHSNLPISTNCTLYFAVKLTKSEKVLIHKLHSFFGIGKVYQVKPSSPNPLTHAGYTKSGLYYRVSALSELEKIIEHFDKYPLHGQKINSYKIWKEMFYLKKKNFNRKKRPIDDINKFNKLTRQLSVSSPRNNPWDGDIKE